MLCRKGKIIYQNVKLITKVWVGELSAWIFWDQDVVGYVKCLPTYSF